MSDDQKNLISELRHERYYNLEPLVYGVQHGGVRLVDLVEVPLGSPTRHTYHGDTKYDTANQHCLHLFTL